MSPRAITSMFTLLTLATAIHPAFLDSQYLNRNSKFVWKEIIRFEDARIIDCESMHRCPAQSLASLRTRCDQKSHSGIAPVTLAPRS
jgi:hypothetical protein